jgi:5'(3')-deoxyribonucleotidase
MKFRIREEKPKIAIDVDGTLADTMGALLQMLKDEEGVHHDINEIDDWDNGVVRVFGSYEKFCTKFEKIWRDGREKIQPHVTREKLEELSRYYEIFIVSNRSNGEHEEFIADWLKKKFGLEFKVILVKEMIDKMKIGEFTIIIDDAPILVEAAENFKDKTLILVKRPWNKRVSEEKKSENIFYAETTEEAINLAISLATTKKTKSLVRV